MPFAGVLLRRFFGRLCELFAGGREASCAMAETRLIVGLGNPGREYAGTRHNAGFEAVDLLAERLVADVKRKKFGGLLGECVVGDTKVLLVKPQGYMNRSGQVVATVLGFYKLSLSDVMVVTDDIALEPGRIRIRAKGSAGGHNGLKDIIAKSGSEAFGRLRVGVGGPGDRDRADYVLSRPPAEERRAIEKAIVLSAEALECWLAKGIDAAMNKYNVRQSEAE